MALAARLYATHHPGLPVRPYRRPTQDIHHPAQEEEDTMSTERDKALAEAHRHAAAASRRLVELGDKR